jgi:hypothetical protein
VAAQFVQTAGLELVVVFAMAAIGVALSWIRDLAASVPRSLHAGGASTRLSTMPPDAPAPSMRHPSDRRRASTPCAQFVSANSTPWVHRMFTTANGIMDLERYGGVYGTTFV